MTGRSHRLGGQIHAADERRLARLAGVDQPALLMLTIGAISAIPADAETRAARFEHFAVFRRTWERAAIADALRIRPPEKHAYVEASLGRAVQHVEQRAAAVRHPEFRRKEGDREPDAVLRGANGLGDAAEGGHAVHQRPYGIAGARRISA